MLLNYLQDLCIPDGGAAYHIEGKTCLPLTPLTGSNAKFAHGGKTCLPVMVAHVTGFDEEETPLSGSNVTFAHVTGLMKKQLKSLD